MASSAIISIHPATERWLRWHRMHVPATPAQLRALLDDPLSKRLVMALWTAELGALLDVEELNEICTVLAPQQPSANRHGVELLELLSDESIPWDVKNLEQRVPNLARRRRRPPNIWRLPPPSMCSTGWPLCHPS